jgi:uncharacterized protein (TIGR03083 family)
MPRPDRRLPKHLPGATVGGRHYGLGMPTHLSLDDHLAALVHSGRVLRDTAAAAGLEAPVPTCPAWTVRKLVTHQGMVHRWAAANLRRKREFRARDAAAEAAAAPDLLAWFSAGLEALREAIRTTADDARALVFLNDAPPPRRFWARRQAHETTIHSADAVAARVGRWPAAADLPIDPQLAADGVDELLCGFITRGKGKLNSPEPMTVVVAAEDAGRAWTIRLTPESLTTDPGAAAQPDATLSGTAAQLYLGLWNRGDEIVVNGRGDLLPRWRERVRVRWGG